MNNFIVKTLKFAEKNDVPAGGEPPKKDLGKEPVKPEDLGYESPKPPEKKEDPPKPPEKKVEEKVIEKPGTGYGKEPPKVEEPPPAKKEDPPKEPPTDLDKKLEVLEKVTHDRVKKKIADLGLEGEKLDKFIAAEAADQKAAKEWRANQEQKQKEAVANQRKAWDKELREDPAFGGDKFEVNLHRCEKVLDEHFSELKKNLTEAGAMLPPSVMRGLARVADALYPDREIVHGEPPVDEKPEESGPNDHLAFYQ